MGGWGLCPPNNFCYALMFIAPQINIEPPKPTFQGANSKIVAKSQRPGWNELEWKEMR